VRLRLSLSGVKRVNLGTQRVMSLKLGFLAMKNGMVF